MAGYNPPSPKLSYLHPQHAQPIQAHKHQPYVFNIITPPKKNIKKDIKDRIAASVKKHTQPMSTPCLPHAKELLVMWKLVILCVQNTWPDIITKAAINNMLQRLTANSSFMNLMNANIPY